MSLTRHITIGISEFDVTFDDADSIMVAWRAFKASPEYSRENRAGAMFSAFLQGWIHGRAELIPVEPGDVDAP